MPCLAVPDPLPGPSGGAGGPERFAALDGLRAIAVALVLARHGVRPFVEGGGGSPLLDLGGWDLATPLLNGWLGVDLFFVLSGFLICHHLLRREQDGVCFSYARYLRDRALRILPAYLAVLIICAAGVIPFFAVSNNALAIRLAYHFLLLQDYLPADINVVFWSLGVEEKFYLLAPLLLGLTWHRGRFRSRIIAVLLFASAGMAASALTLYWRGLPDGYPAFWRVYRSPFHQCLLPLAAGMLVALIRERVWSKIVDGAARRGRAQGIMALGLVLVLSLFLGEPLMARIELRDVFWTPLVAAVGFAFLVMAAVAHGVRWRILGHRLLRRVAELSYALYLVHLPLIPLSMKLAGVDGTGGLVGLACFVPVYLALSLIAAMILHQAIERPFLRIKSALSAAETNRRTGRPELSTAASSR